jgi:transposase
LQELPQVFERRERTASQVAAYEQQIEELYAEIGRLTTQVAWLKKKSGLTPEHRAAGHGRASAS